MNVIVGQAKLAILKTRKNQLLGTGLTDLVRLFRVLLVSRVLVDFNYFKMVRNPVGFQERWCVGDSVCSVTPEGELNILF